MQNGDKGYPIEQAGDELCAWEVFTHTGKVADYLTYVQMTHQPQTVDSASMKDPLDIE